MKTFRNYSGNGFSLIELIITIAILGILSGFALPAYTDWVKQAKITKTRTDVKTLCELVSRYELEKNDLGKQSSIRLGATGIHEEEYVRGSDSLKGKDITAVVEKDSQYGVKQNNTGKFEPIRLKNLNELKGKYIKDPEQLRDAWGQFFKVLPPASYLVWTLRKPISDKVVGTQVIKKYAQYTEDMPSKPSELELKGLWKSGQWDCCGKCKPDCACEHCKNCTCGHCKVNITPFYALGRVRNPMIIYSCGPNGRDEKGNGDDIKYECRLFCYMSAVVDDIQRPGGN